MKSLIITPRDKREYESAFSLLAEFGKERNRLSLDDDEEISFAFLMKDAESIEEFADKSFPKKSPR